MQFGWLAGSAIRSATAGVSVAIFAASLSTAVAEPSVYDRYRFKEITGTVKEFRFVSPRTILVVTVRGKDGAEKDWTFEGGAPGQLTRQGMTSLSLKPGDEITAIINLPLNGAESGAFRPSEVHFRDGRPVVVEAPRD